MARHLAILLLVILPVGGCRAGRGRERQAPTPTSGPPVYRCDPAGEWSQVPLGEELHCDEGGEFFCPGERCEAFYHWWNKNDVTWGRARLELEKRGRPFGMWQAYGFVILPPGAPPPGPIWTPPKAAALTAGVAGAVAH
jgi:hypothetical protein